MPLFILLPLTGLAAGLFGGYLGIGGGVLMVPVLIEILQTRGIPTEHLFQIAFGTALCAAIGTAVVSAYNYSRAGRVAWNVFLWTAIPAVVTSLIGSTLAAASAPDLLRTTFSIFLILSVIILLRGKFTPHEENVPVRHVALIGTGIIAGAASAYLGIAGGVIMVSLFLIWAKLPVEKGPGTSAAVGIVTTTVGTIGYIIHGWGLPDLPNGTFGFVFPIYAVAMMFGTILGAPIGAKLNRRFGTKVFRYVFAIFLLFIAGRLLFRSF